MGQFEGLNIPSNVQCSLKCGKQTSPYINTTSLKPKTKTPTPKKGREILLDLNVSFFLTITMLLDNAARYGVVEV
jgi:hypothetical protein